MFCTICKSDSISDVRKIKDFSISKEVFQIAYCNNCQNHFTVNPPSEAEIGPYYEAENYISHSETKQGLINKLYHIVRKKNLKNKLNLVNANTPGKNLLDYGCGAGEFASFVKENGYSVSGIEPSPTASEIARKKGINVSSPNELQQLSPKSFDVITLWHVLEHVHQLDATLKAFNTITKDAATLIIAVPNIESYDSQFYKEYWAALDVPRHLYHYTQKGMKQLVEQYGFQLDKKIKMPFDSYYVSLLSEQYKNQFPKPLQWFRAFLIASISNLKQSGKNQSSVIYIFKKNATLN